MSYNLFIDDIRSPHWSECVSSGVDPSLDWIIARSSIEAIRIVRSKGCLPSRMALDHDLGPIGYGTNAVDIVPNFLHVLANDIWNGADPIPEYTIHSANPVGASNMRSFMESWKRSMTL